MNVTNGMAPMQMQQPQFVAAQPAVQEQQQQYNAVSITVHKPTLDAPGAQQPVQVTEAPVNPYSYPAAPIFNYPQGSIYGSQPQPEAMPLPAQYNIPQSVIPAAEPNALPAAAPVEMTPAV